MKILEYHYRDVEDPGWEFDSVKFGDFNLMVGDTATGKTRLQNTIFSLGRFVAAKEFKHGNWNLTLEHAGTKYLWSIRTARPKTRTDLNNQGFIEEEKLIKLDDAGDLVLVERDEGKFLFQNNPLPKLAPEEASIALLREENDVRPVFEAFEIIMRRRFFHDALAKISELQPIPRELFNTLEKSRSIDVIFSANMNLSANLLLLQRYFAKDYNALVEKYLEIFPFLKEAKIKDLSDVYPNVAVAAAVPIFSVRERNSENWIPVMELSSGMQKVLLILTDLSIIPVGGVYLIDEYENSLGHGAIDFLPNYLAEYEKDLQFFVTSHHPYLINAIPTKDWYVFHRTGMRVKIQFGPTLEERYRKSKQQAFIQLINDPFFLEGVE